MSEAPAIDLAVLFPPGLALLPGNAAPVGSPGESFGDLLESLEWSPQPLPLHPQVNLLGAPAATAEPALPLPLRSNDMRLQRHLPVVAVPAGSTGPGGSPGATAPVGDPAGPPPLAAGSAPVPIQPNPAQVSDTAAPASLGGAASQFPTPRRPAPEVPVELVRAALKAIRTAAPPPAGTAPARPPGPAAGENPVEFQLPQTLAPATGRAAPRISLDAGSTVSRLTAPTQAASVSGDAKGGPAVTLPDSAAVAFDHTQGVSGGRPSATGMLHAGPELGQQLGQRLDWMLRTQTHSAEIRVFPRDLGTVRINLSIDADAVEIFIEASSPQMLQELHQAAPRLRSMMSEQGLGLTHLEIDQQRSQDRQTDTAGWRANFDSGAANRRQPTEEELPRSGGGNYGAPIHRLVDVFA